MTGFTDWLLGAVLSRPHTQPAYKVACAHPSPPVPSFTPAMLRSLLTRAAASPGYKTFEAAPDVLEALEEVIPPRPKQEYSPAGIMSGTIYDFMAVPLIPDGSLAPRHFVLVSHNACTVDEVARNVTHEKCEVVRGKLDPAPAASMEPKATS